MAATILSLKRQLPRVDSAPSWDGLSKVEQGVLLQMHNLERALYKLENVGWGAVHLKKDEARELWRYLTAMGIVSNT